MSKISQPKFTATQAEDENSVEYWKEMATLANEELKIEKGLREEAEGAQAAMVRSLHCVVLEEEDYKWMERLGERHAKGLDVWWEEARQTPYREVVRLIVGMWETGRAKQPMVQKAIETMTPGAARVARIKDVAEETWGHGCVRVEGDACAPDDCAACRDEEICKAVRRVESDPQRFDSGTPSGANVQIRSGSGEEEPKAEKVLVPFRPRRLAKSVERWLNGTLWHLGCDLRLYHVGADGDLMHANGSITGSALETEFRVPLDWRGPVPEWGKWVVPVVTGGPWHESGNVWEHWRDDESWCCSAEYRVHEGRLEARGVSDKWQETVDNYPPSDLVRVHLHAPRGWTGPVPEGCCLLDERVPVERVSRAVMESFVSARRSVWITTKTNLLVLRTDGVCLTWGEGWTWRCTAGAHSMSEGRSRYAFLLDTDTHDHGPLDEERFFWAAGSRACKVTKTIAVVSGGMDSATLLWWLLDQGDEVRALSVDYGQRHVKELECARVLCELKGVEHRIADLSSIRDLLAGSALTSDDVEVPEGHYTDESMKKTVVSNRNMILLSLAIGWAISLKYDQVAYAAHAGDHQTYPDCRPAFIERVDQLAQVVDWHPVTVSVPFIKMTKAEITKLGFSLGVPFKATWSCYLGEEKHCGRCATCLERQEAFKEVGLIDPTEYEETE